MLFVGLPARQARLPDIYIVFVFVFVILVVIDRLSDHEYESILETPLLKFWNYG